MNKLIQEFPNHIKAVLKLLESQDLAFDQAKNFQNIVICGLGGSGIGGQIAKKLVEQELEIPFTVISDYNLPAFVNEKSLVIANSYSGETEETLNALEQAKNRNATIFAISSNGQLLNKAKENNWKHVQVPGGYPPRAALAFSLVTQLVFLEKNKLVGTKYTELLADTAPFIENEMGSIQEETKKIADVINGKTPVLYGDQHLEAILIRGRQQINENAKMLCWHHVFPEMNHNETVGWAGGTEANAVLMLHTDFDFERTKTRMEITRGIIEEKTKTIIDIHAKGKNFVEQAFYLIHFLDWLSYDLSVLKNVDPIEVKIIDYLKGELAKL